MKILDKTGLHVPAWIVGILALAIFLAVVNLGGMLLIWKHSQSLRERPIPLTIVSARLTEKIAKPGDTVSAVISFVKVRHCENNIVRRWLQGGPDKLTFMIEEFEAGDFALGADTVTVPIHLPDGVPNRVEHEPLKPGEYFITTTSEYVCEEGKRTAEPFSMGPIWIGDAEGD